MAQAVPIALGAIQIAQSIGKGAKLKKEAAELEKNKPIKRTSQFNNDALALSESELANGMSAGAEKSYNDATDRSLASSISALLKGGASVNNVGEIYDSSEQGRQNLAIMEDQMRLNHVQGVLKQYDTQANEEEKNWMVNEYGPYRDKAQAIGEQRKAAAQLGVSGMNTFGTGLMNALDPDKKLGTDPFENGSKPFNSTQIDSTGRAASGTGSGSIGLAPDRIEHYLATPTPSGNAWSNFWDTYKLKI